MNPDLKKVLAKIRTAQLAEFDGVDAKLDNPNESGLFGTTPLHIVAGWGDLESARILLDAGAEIDVPAEEDCTPLHEAIMRGHVEVTRLLISRGADLQRKCSFGNALELAKSGDNEAIKRLVTESASQ